MTQTTGYKELYSQAVRNHQNGLYREAEAQYKSARSTAASELGEDHLFVQDILEKQARLYMTTGRYDRCLTLLQKLRSTKEKVFGEHHPATARIVRKLAAVLDKQGRTSEAESLCGLAVDIWVDFLGPLEPASVADLHDFESLYGSRSRLGDADSILSRLTTRITKDPQNDTAHRRSLGTALAEIAAALATRGATTTSRRLAELAFEYLDGSADARWEHASTTVLLSSLYVDSGDFPKAEVLLTQHLQTLDATFGSSHDVAPWLWNVLARALAGQGRYDEAITVLKQALAAQELILDPEHPNVAETYFQLAEIYRAVGNQTEAESFHRRALRLREEALGLEHVQVADSLVALGQLSAGSGRFDEAEALFQRAARIRETKIGPRDESVGVVLDHLADLYTRMGKFSKAEVVLSHSLEIKRLVLPEDHRDLAIANSKLGSVYLESGKLVDAEICFKRSITILEPITSDPSNASSFPMLSHSLERLAVVLQQQFRLSESERLFRLALEVLEEQPHNAGYQQAATKLGLAELQLTRWRFGESARLAKEVQSLLESGASPAGMFLVCRSLVLSARLHALAGAPDKARSCLTEADAIAARFDSSAEDSRVHSQRAVTALLMDMSLFRDAEAILDKAMTRARAEGMTEQVVFAHLLEQAGRLEYRKHREETAMEYFKQALHLRERHYGKDHPDYARSHVWLARCLARQAALSKAEESYHRALQCLERTIGSSHPELASTLAELAVVCAGRGLLEDCVQLCRRATTIWERSPLQVDLEVLETLLDLVPLLVEANDLPLVRRLLELVAEIAEPAFALFGSAASQQVLVQARFLILRGYLELGVMLSDTWLDAYESQTRLQELPTVQSHLRDFIEFMEELADIDALKSLRVRLANQLK